MIAVGIDIGTNTALMVVASITHPATVEILHDVHELPRLGEGLDHHGMIGDAARDRARSAVERFRAVIADATADDNLPALYAVATSALREASNGDVVRRELESILGWPITVISGNEEAELTYYGAVGHHEPSASMIDIGGGSTEFVAGRFGELQYRISTSLGVVRCMERYVSKHPVTTLAQDEIRAHVRRELEPHADKLSGSSVLVGTAGTPTALAMIDLELPAYDASLTDGHNLSLRRIDELATWLCMQTREELCAIPGLDARRADIVPIGAIILSESMHILGYNSLRVSTRGLRHGALERAIQQYESPLE